MAFFDDLLGFGGIIGGTVIETIGAINEGTAAKKQAGASAELIDLQADAARADAEITREQAERERILGRQAEEDFRVDQSRLMAHRRALLGASGVEGGSGSPILVTQDLASEIELNALRLRSGSEIKVSRLEQFAEQQREEGGFLDKQADLTRKSGEAAQTAGRLRGGALLLSGAGKAFGTFG